MVPARPSVSQGRNAELDSNHQEKFELRCTTQHLRQLRLKQDRYPPPLRELSLPLLAAA